MRATTTARHERARALFRELYEVQRLRFDDAVKQVADVLFLSVATVERILTHDDGHHDDATTTMPPCRGASHHLHPVQVRFAPV